MSSIFSKRKEVNSDTNLSTFSEDNLKEKKKGIDKGILISILILLLFGVSLFLAFNIKYTYKLQDERNLLKKENISLKYDLDSTKDSLNREKGFSTKYKDINLSIEVRDKATKGLKYKVGDIIFTKPDSTKFVIRDIIIGGTDNEYYVKYRLSTSLINGEEIEINENLIY